MSIVRPSFVESFYAVPSPKEGFTKSFVPLNLFVDECQRSQGPSNLGTRRVSPSHSANDLYDNVMFELPPRVRSNASMEKTQTKKKKAWQKTIHAFWHGLHLFSKNKKNF